MSMSLMDQAYRLIRRDIVCCALAPGAEFTEFDLAERLQMSKTPVREALARLQFEGLVKAYPRRGYQIEPIRVSDINEIFDSRLILEAGAIEIAVNSATEHDLQALTKLAAESSDSNYSHDIEHALKINNDFHEAIVLATRNLRLHRMVAATIKELERFFYLEARSQQSYPPGHISHNDIVETLRERNAKHATLAMKEHIESTRQVLIHSLLQGAIETKRGSEVQIL